MSGFLWGGMNLEIPKKAKKNYKKIAKEELDRSIQLAIDKNLELNRPDLYRKVHAEDFDVWYESITGYKWQRKWEADVWRIEHEIEFAEEFDSNPNSARQRALELRHTEDLSRLTGSERRRMYMTLATPEWCDMQEIRSIYLSCKIKTLLTGVVHHVDHIVPIQGKNVCGFHVHTNLRIITAHENLTKKNKFEDDDVSLDKVRGGR